MSKALHTKPTLSLVCEGDSTMESFPTFDGQNTNNAHTASIDVDFNNTNATSTVSNIVIPKLTFDATPILTTNKQKKATTALSNEAPVPEPFVYDSQTNLIILNTPPSPAATTQHDEGVSTSQRNLQPQQQESVLSRGPGNTLTPTYLSTSNSSTTKLSPATSPLAALRRPPGARTPISDPVSPNVPTVHPDLDRRHSDSTSWQGLSVSTKVSTSISNSSATSSVTSASTTEVSDSQDSPLLHRLKTSVTVEGNDHTYQNTNLVGQGKFLMEMEIRIFSFKNIVSSLFFIL